MPRPTPQFLPRNPKQIDLVYGDLEFQVPKDHVVRWLWAELSAMDLSAADRRCSHLGRRGIDPRVKLAVVLYGSLRGLHFGSEMSEAVRMDAAFRWLTGGRTISDETLNRFVREHGDLLVSVHMQVVQRASDLGLLRMDQVAIDSMRLRADASRASIRTLARSKKRLEQLSKVDTEALSEEAREVHAEKVAKHEEAVKTCEERGVTSFSTTCEGAALMKFPDGAAMPGHRLQVMSSGVSSRFIVALLVTADPTDYGGAEEVIEAGRRVLEQVGAPTLGGVVKAALDAGYWSPESLRYILEQEEKGWLDALVASPRQGGEGAADGTETAGAGRFGRDRFRVEQDGSVTCPAGSKMHGPTRAGEGLRRELRYTGIGCGACPLKEQCTPGKQRTVSFRPEADALATWMESKLEQDKQGPRRYAQRIATVEPVFAHIEQHMAYRRATSRKLGTVKNQVLLKVIAYNLSRLRSRRPMALFFVPESWSAIWSNEHLWELPHDLLDDLFRAISRGTGAGLTPAGRGPGT